MKNTIFGSLLFIGSISFAQDNAYPTYTDPLNAKQFVLENGLTVMLSENHNTSQIFGVIAVKAGGKNDPKDATGMAHYLEHMLFKGTEEMGTWNYEKESVHLKEIERLYEELGKTKDEKQRAAIQQKINEEAIKAGQYAIPNEMDRMLSEIGSTGVNAFTTEDFTAYHNAFPANKLDQWLQIYDHRFEQPVFRLFQSELETVYEEKNRSMDSPFSAVLDEFNKNFWKNHPYGQQPIIGLTEHLKNPSLQKMYEYFNTYYVANNMILSLSGDFDTDEAIALIRKYFSDWRKGKIPVFPKYEEADFKGKEVVNIKATPVKAAIRGYRIPSNGHPDQQKIQLANYLLTNNEGSGLLDNLTSQGKISFSGMFPMEYNDYSGSIIFVIPKIIGQSFDEADVLLNQQMNKLRKGDFDDAFFEGAKLSLQKNFDKQLESNEERALLMMSAFTSNTPWIDYLNNFKQIKNFSKTEVVEAINKYYGENYLALYSGMGSAKKDKLSKPKFEAVIPPDGKVSSFTKTWRETETPYIKANFVDFDKDISRTTLEENKIFRSVKNPFNQIFNLQISWGAGIQSDSLLNYLPAYLNKIGTKELEVTAFKNKLFQLGASINFRATENEFILDIEGMDENLTPTIVLVNDFLKNYNPNKEAIISVADETESNRKLSNKDLMNLMSATQQFALFGNKSTFLTELSSADIKKLTPEQMINSFKNAQNYGIKINYVGTKTHAEVQKIITDNILFEKVTKPALAKIKYEMKGFDSKKVYFVNDKKAVQSQVLFLVEGLPMESNMLGEAEAFNLYFGGDMSSLVFQEIREFRSLAYSTSAKYQIAEKPGVKNLFYGYVGCQGDKTPEAAEVMFDLITKMPIKKEREAAIRAALISEAKTSKPGFRTLISKVDDWQRMGFNKDPNLNLLPYYTDLTFDQIIEFYKNHISGKNMQLVVVGNKKKFDLKTIKKYGQLIELKTNQVVKN
jgi:predicted Zn-dependent peptidase